MLYEEKAEVSINGKHYTLTQDMVVEAAKRLKKEGYPLRPGMKYHVIVDNTEFSPSALFAEALGIMNIESQGQQAFRVLTQLGFVVTDKKRREKEKANEAGKAKQ